MMLDDNDLLNVTGGAGTITCKRYTVKKGDNLTKLAKKYGTTVEMLVRLNDIEDKNLIRIGQTLLIPVS